VKTIRQVTIPTLVRVKPGALDRLGIYARRYAFERVCFLHSEGLPPALLDRVTACLEKENVRILQRNSVLDASMEVALELFKILPARTQAIIGLGGGKALDVAKYVSFLSGTPYLSVPGSLSNDGFCSPQSSLQLDGRRRSLPSAMPFGVVLDTEVCLAAPELLWLSGVGDLVAKFTAVADWKLAFHACGTPVDDFAALLSDATVHQFLAHPRHDQNGIRLLGTALMLNGIAMGICGSSRPASGSEHLISHALDAIGPRPRLHGLQVGVASYLVSLLQGNNFDLINGLFEATGFWRAIQADPFSRSCWLKAARKAPGIKQDFYTVLSSKDWLPEIERLLREEPQLKNCFVD
jgi:glycerol-1-phosphate dehydrogenase [NAD(P)+]